MTDALGYKWNYTYDLVDQLTKSVDRRVKATEVAYNLVGEISSITKPETAGPAWAAMATITGPH